MEPHELRGTSRVPTESTDMRGSGSKVLSRVSLCDLCRSGPTRRKTGAVIAAWASRTKREAGLLLLPALLWKVGVLQDRHPHVMRTRTAPKKQNYIFVYPHQTEQ